jgi:hypothetical protein
LVILARRTPAENLRHFILALKHRAPDVLRKFDEALARSMEEPRDNDWVFLWLDVSAPVHVGNLLKVCRKTGVAPRTANAIADWLDPSKPHGFQEVDLIRWLLYFGGDDFSTFVLEARTREPQLYAQIKRVVTEELHSGRDNLIVEALCEEPFGNVFQLLESLRRLHYELFALGAGQMHEQWLKDAYGQRLERQICNSPLDGVTKFLELAKKYPETRPRAQDVLAAFAAMLSNEAGEVDSPEPGAIHAFRIISDAPPGQAAKFIKYLASLAAQEHESDGASTSARLLLEHIKSMWQLALDRGRGLLGDVTLAETAPIDKVIDLLAAVDRFSPTLAKNLAENLDSDFASSDSAITRSAVESGYSALGRIQKTVSELSFNLDLRKLEPRLCDALQDSNALREYLKPLDLAQLNGALRFSSQRMPSLCSILLQELKRDLRESLGLMADAISRAANVDMVGILRISAEIEGSGENSLTQELRQYIYEHQADMLLPMICRPPLFGIASLLGQLDVEKIDNLIRGQEIRRRIDLALRDKNEKRWRQAAGFMRLADQLKDCRYRPFIRWVACRLLAQDTDFWSKNPVNILDVSCALQFARESIPNIDTYDSMTQEFLDRILTPGWLKYRYVESNRFTSDSGIAKSIFHLLVVHPDWVVARFRDKDALSDRVKKRLEQLESNAHPDQTADFVRLWASAALLGCASVQEEFKDRICAVFRVEGILQGMVESQSNKDDCDTLRQLWIAIRMLRWGNPDRLTVSSEQQQAGKALWEVLRNESGNVYPEMWVRSMRCWFEEGLVEPEHSKAGRIDRFGLVYM